MRHLIVPSVALALAALLTGCTSGPDYRRPPAPSSATWKENAAWKEGAGWRTATPDDGAVRGPWWSVFADPDLDTLANRVAVSNQNVAAAEAAWRNAIATLAEAKSGSSPTVGANASATRSGTGTTSLDHAAGSSDHNGVEDHVALAGTVSWAPDLWGKVRRQSEAAGATAQASAADLANVTLVAQSSLATLYLELRASDAEKRLRHDLVADSERILAIARHRYDAGLSSRADVLSAEADVASTRANLIAITATRAQYEHAIAVLVGVPPAELSIAERPDLPTLPTTPVGVPSALLERRPDIAAAERRMAAANAHIGVAEAAYYPDLTLSGSLGFAGSALGSLISAPSLAWSAGAGLAGTIYDGGARDAVVNEAKANWDAAVATYRQTVLTAFQQVEDALATLRTLADQEAAEQHAVDAAMAAEHIAENQYHAGTISHADLLQAHTITANDRLALLQIRARRLTTTVSLITALGGGWQTTTP